jgi:hypothetical protein
MQRLILIGCVCWLLALVTLSLVFDREPRFVHVACYQFGRKIAEADGVHLEQRGKDLVFYHRYENFHPHRVARAYDPASGIVVVTAPEHEK